MTLSTEQIDAVKLGQPVRITPTEVGADCIVLRADVYEKIQAVLDDGLSAMETAALIEANMREDDANDPLLESYQRYRE